MKTLLDHIRAIAAAVAKFAWRDGDGFTCGMCERNAHCGMPPHPNCEYRLRQITERWQRPGPAISRPPLCSHDDHAGLAGPMVS